MPGLFLSLDGIDGCGKSTQCRLLADWLRARGHAVTLCRDPGGTPLGDQLRKVLLESGTPRCAAAEALLFMASRAQLVADVIRPALERGEIIVSDRYLLSTVVYQGYGKGLSPQLLREAGGLSTGGLQPVLTVVLDIPVELARSRLSRPADQMERLGDDFFQRVREGFLAEARQNSHSIRVVDATLPVEAVHDRIAQEVSRVLETPRRT